MEQHEEEQEGMSTKKKVAAGAAVGLAVPAAVGVARKLMGNDDSDEQSGPSESDRRTPQRSSRAARTTKSQASRAASKTSSSARRAGRAGEKTKEQLYRQAQRLKIEGRSKMTKAQLERAVSRTR